MILNNNYKSIAIDITTYQKHQQGDYLYNTMNACINEKGYRKCNENRFICSICLNKKASPEENRHIECCKRKSKSCPICHRSETDGNKNANQNGYRINEARYKEDKLQRASVKTKHDNDKDMYIQTSQPDVTQGLTLLNEVLTVFQSKKQTDLKKESGFKTVTLKDASVETDRLTPKLTLSKTFLYSIGEINQRNDNNGKFSIINCQPETAKVSELSIDLIKHKSSSIPQMKLEELKNSLKEKTKSKDAIEEVNRMFATVKKREPPDCSDDTNRPMIRIGPRVLPVVKSHNTDVKNRKQYTQNCRCCQTSYRMSSGDSFTRHKSCQPDLSECCHVSCSCKHQCCLNTEKCCDHYCNTSTECKQT